jgi:hypothetical protein
VPISTRKCPYSLPSTHPREKTGKTPFTIGALKSRIMKENFKIE